MDRQHSASGRQAARAGAGARLAWALALVMALAGPALARADDRMRFARVEGGFCPLEGCILAKGRIGPDTHRAFAQAVRELKIQPGAELILDSPGGDLVDGLKLGLQIRKAGLRTRVADASTTPPSSGLCASACAYAFLGGVVRQVDGAARLGVHQFGDPSSGGALSAAGTQQLVAVIADYFAAVGANLRLETVALRTPPNQIHWLSRHELEALSVVTSAEEASAPEVGAAG